jgi:hypothetical protein
MVTIDDIRNDVKERNPNLDFQSIEFKAEVICLLLWCAEEELPSGTSAMRAAICAETEYDEDSVGGIIAALEAGKSLTDGHLYQAIKDELEGDNSGIVIALLVNVALGRSRFNPEHCTFSLTDRGIRHVRSMLSTPGA